MDSKAKKGAGQSRSEVVLEQPQNRYCLTSVAVIPKNVMRFERGYQFHDFKNS